MINVTIWNEFLHERDDLDVREIYPDGIHVALAKGLGVEKDFSLRTATLDQPQNGLSQDVLDNTDVLLWWAHLAHDQVADEVVDRIQSRVLAGMGLIVLHSGHMSKIFRRLMGTSCALTWREDGARERLWVIDATHPIAAGLDAFIELPQTEMYGEVFDVPAPDELIFLSWFAGGELFRSGCAWRRGRGRVFYFRPGHETYPIYYDERVLMVLKNAVRWALFDGNTTAKGIGEAVHQPVIP